MRRCGKSSFLRMFMLHLAETGLRPADEIIYVDLEASENAEVRTAADLAARVKSLTKHPRRRNLLFLDEVQYGLYVQVATTALDPQTLDRELSPLRDTGDDFPKLLLTLDTVQPDDFAGIRHIRVPDFLLSDPARPV